MRKNNANMNYSLISTKHSEEEMCFIFSCYENYIRYTVFEFLYWKINYVQFFPASSQRLCSLVKNFFIWLTICIYSIFHSWFTSIIEISFQIYSLDILLDNLHIQGCHNPQILNRSFEHINQWKLFWTQWIMYMLYF